MSYSGSETIIRKNLLAVESQLVPVLASLSEAYLLALDLPKAKLFLDEATRLSASTGRKKNFVRELAYHIESVETLSPSLAAVGIDEARRRLEAAVASGAMSQPFLDVQSCGTSTWEILLHFGHALSVSFDQSESPFAYQALVYTDKRASWRRVKFDDIVFLVGRLAKDGVTPYKRPDISYLESRLSLLEQNRMSYLLELAKLRTESGDLDDALSLIGYVREKIAFYGLGDAFTVQSSTLAPEFLLESFKPIPAARLSAEQAAETLEEAIASLNPHEAPQLGILSHGDDWLIQFLLLTSSGNAFVTISFDLDRIPFLFQLSLYPIGPAPTVSYDCASFDQVLLTLGILCSQPDRD